MKKDIWFALFISCAGLLSSWENSIAGPCLSKNRVATGPGTKVWSDEFMHKAKKIVIDYDLKYSIVQNSKAMSNQEKLERMDQLKYECTEKIAPLLVKYGGFFTFGQNSSYTLQGPSYSY